MSDDFARSVRESRLGSVVNTSAKKEVLGNGLRILAAKYGIIFVFYWYLVLLSLFRQCEENVSEK